jgi:hypothetical protein
MIISNYYDSISAFFKDLCGRGRGNSGEEKLVPDWSNAEWTAQWPGEDDYSVEEKIHRTASQRSANTAGVGAGIAGIGSAHQTNGVGMDKEKISRCPV